MDQQKIIEEYKHEQEIYIDFCRSIIFLLEKLLKNNSFQYQMVSSRVKDIESIKSKLTGNRKISNIESIRELDDFAGCRVIFYLDSELQRFISFIYQEFEVIKNNLRYSNDDYNAHHLIIKFKEDRLKLTEYKQFDGMICELQLTTVLFHAWSEVSHNITYKTPAELREFDNDSVESLKNHLKEIMENLIKPANYRLQYIQKEYLKLQEGRRIFDIAFLNRILQSQNRNEMYESLSLLTQYVRKYGDKSPSDLRLPDFISFIIKKSKKLKTIVPKVLGFGYEHRHVAEECINILDMIKYQYPEQVFLLLVDLSLEKDREIRNKAENVLKGMSKYHLKILQKIGFSVQFFMIDLISKWKTSEQLKRLPLIKTIFTEMFKLEYESITMEDYKTFSFGFGLLNAEGQIKQIRFQAIQLLMVLFENTSEILEKIMILETLCEASKTPNRGNYSEEIDRLVKDNTRFLVEWYITIVDKGNVSFEIIKEINKQLIWFKRRHSSINELVTLEEKINRNEQFLVFKVLVGFDHDNFEDLNWRDAREKRIKKIEEYAASITESSQNFWLGIILDIAKGRRPDKQGEYEYFNQFLYSIALTNSNFTKELITGNEGLLNNMLSHLIAGLWRSDNVYSREKLGIWIANGEHLLDCVASFFYLDSIELPILDAICSQAIAVKDINVLNEVVRLIILRKSNSIESKELFIKVIKALYLEKNYWWTNYVWFNENSILNNFDDSEHDQMLDILLNCPHIDYHVEQLLIPIANSNPIKIVHFLEKRIQIQNRKKKVWSKNYDAIPHHFSNLGEILNQRSEDCLPTIFTWYKKKHWLYHWEAGELLQKIFPTFKGELESYFLRILPRKEKKEANIMLQVLNRYDGDRSIFGFCKQFIVTYNDEPELLKELMHVLSQTGVVSGEYGFVEAYTQQKKEIRKWNKTKNPYIKQFVKDYVDYLNACISAETKRSDEQVEFMKLEYGQGKTI